MAGAKYDIRVVFALKQNGLALARTGPDSSRPALVKSDGAFERAVWGERLTGADEATVHPLIVEIVPKQR